MRTDPEAVSALFELKVTLGTEGHRAGCGRKKQRYEAHVHHFDPKEALTCGEGGGAASVA